MAALKSRESLNNSALASRAPGRNLGPMQNQAQKLAKTAARRAAAPNTVGGSTAVVRGDRIVGKGVNRSHGNMIQPGKSARFGQKFKLGITPDGKIVHLYGNGRGKNRVVLDRKASPAATKVAKGQDRRAAVKAFAGKNERRRRRRP
jgi:hypothetical protein